MKQNEFKGISKRGKELLSQGEDKHVDYKLRVKGLHAEDLVAFANSKEGGAILIGVAESSDKNGQQIGVPDGIKTDDEAKLQIMGKALSCSPPVQIELLVENSSNKPFYRVEIPSGSHKPYCTNSGTYKIREDGRNNPLHPEQLLAMFLDREGEEFRSRFSQAAGELESKMASTLDVVGDLEHVITAKIDEISNSMGWAEYEASSAKSTIEDVDSYTRAIHKKTQNLEARLRALMNHMEAIDPVKEDAKKEVLDWLIKKLTEDEELLKKAREGKPLSMTLGGDAAGELDKSDLQSILSKAIKELEPEKDA